MGELQRFIEGMNRLIGKTISIEEVSYESLLFEKEEIDETLIPTQILTPLSESIMTTSVDYTDTEGNYYLYLSVSDDEIGLPPYEVWLMNGDTYYREKNVIGYYGEFLCTPIEPFEIVEEVTIEVDEILYLVNRIQDVKLRSIIRHYIAYLEKIVIAKECD